MIEPAAAVKVAVDEPDKIETVGGTVSAAELLASVIVAPPLPAGWDKVTVHVDVAPELRLVGEQDIELKTGFTAVATRVSVTVREAPPWIAVMMAV